MVTLQTVQNQINARWGSASYQDGVNQQSHAALHLMKALGKVAAMLEESEHKGPKPPVDIRPQVADLVICAARVAQLLGMDLQTAVEKRIEEKFPPIR